MTCSECHDTHGVSGLKHQIRDRIDTPIAWRAWGRMWCAPSESAPPGRIAYATVVALFSAALIAWVR